MWTPVYPPGYRAHKPKDKKKCVETSEKVEPDAETGQPLRDITSGMTNSRAAVDEDSETLRLRRELELFAHRAVVRIQCMARVRFARARAERAYEAALACDKPAVVDVAVVVSLAGA